MMFYFLLTAESVNLMPRSCNTNLTQFWPEKPSYCFLWYLWTSGKKSDGTVMFAQWKVLNIVSCFLPTITILQGLGTQTDCQRCGPTHVSWRLWFWLWRLPQPPAELRVAQRVWDVAPRDPGRDGSSGGAEGRHRAVPHASVLLTGKAAWNLEWVIFHCHSQFSYPSWRKTFLTVPEVPQFVWVCSPFGFAGLRNSSFISALDNYRVSSIQPGRSEMSTGRSTTPSTLAHKMPSLPIILRSTTTRKMFMSVVSWSMSCK